MAQALSPQPDHAHERLARLDLTVDDLLVAVRAGVAARRTATRNHPRAYGGWRDYGERVATLRDVLIPRGWTATEMEGVCLVVHPNRRLAVMTALGTSGTGTPEPVTTRRRRGETTERVVRVNAQLELDLGLTRVENPLDHEMTPTWVLLVYADGDEIRSELSLARHMSDEGFLDEWLDRIPLPVLRVNDLLDEPGNDEEDGGHDFDVPEL